MTSNLPSRKVLVIKDESSMRNVLRILVAGLRYERDAGPGIQQVLWIIRQDQFDTVLLDLRSNEPPQRDPAITGLRPVLQGRVLAITGEVSNPGILEMIEHYAVPHTPTHRVPSNASTGVEETDRLTCTMFQTEPSKLFTS